MLLSSRSAQCGTGDGGGGNTCLGKPIESFRTDFSQTPAFQNFLKEKIEQPDWSMDRSSLNAMSWIIHEKPWYLIPRKCAHKELKHSRTGLPFHSWQSYLQTQNEVFVVKEDFEGVGMKPAELANLKVWQATMLTHEMAMGMKFLKNEDERTQCLAARFNPNASAIIRRSTTFQLEQCRENGEITGKPQVNYGIPNARAHSEVRKATESLMDVFTKEFKGSKYIGSGVGYEPKVETIFAKTNMDFGAYHFRDWTHMNLIFDRLLQKKLNDAKANPKGLPTNCALSVQYVPEIGALLVHVNDVPLEHSAAVFPVASRVWLVEETNEMPQGMFTADGYRPPVAGDCPPPPLEERVAKLTLGFGEKSIKKISITESGHTIECLLRK
jgi:hypothetical protein